MFVLLFRKHELKLRLKEIEEALVHLDGQCIPRPTEPDKMSVLHVHKKYAQRPQHILVFVVLLHSEFVVKNEFVYGFW